MANPLKIFVSYAHVDREPNPLNPEGWAAYFLDYLASQLPAGIGRVEYIDLWLDRTDLALNEPTDAQIDGAIDDAAIFLMIASKAYTESTYCMERELPRFLRRQLRDRIFVVERTPVDAAKFPPFYRDLTAIRLWRGDPEKRWRPLDAQVVEEDKGDFYKLVWDLINDLSRLVNDLRSAEAAANGGNWAPTPLMPAADSERAIVFLAEPTDDIAEDLEMGLPKLKGYLQQSGVRLIQPERAVGTIEEYEAALDQLMHDSKIFVQMLSHLAGRQLPSRNPDEEGMRLTAMQLEAARRHRLARMFWRWPKADLTAQAGNIRHFDLLHGRGLQEGEEFHAGTIESFGAAIIKQVQAALAPPAPALNPVERIVVQRFEGDDGIARLITRTLQQLGFPDSSVPQITGDFEADEAEYERMLRLCEVLLIVHGQPPHKEWLAERVREVYRARAERETPFRACGIYDAPPPDKPPIEREKLRRISLIPARNTPAGEVDRQRLENFLAGAGLL